VEEGEIIRIAGRDVRVTRPQKVLFPGSYSTELGGRCDNTFRMNRTTSDLGERASSNQFDSQVGRLSKMPSPLLPAG